MSRKRSNVSKTDETMDRRERIQTGTARPQMPTQILGTEHLQLLNAIIKECTKTHEICTACMEAGVDVAPEHAVNQEQLEMAKKLKAYFFPTST